MALFEKFRDTVFLKTDCELDRKVAALEALHAKYPNNEKIAHDLFIAKLGLAGEKEIMYELKHANIGMYVIHDLNIEFGDMKAQIDFVVITTGFIYFVECKNLIGNITVNEKGDFIREYSYKGQKIKKGIYSPITQVDRQMAVFKKIWASNRSKLASFFFDKNFDYIHKTIAVMAKQENILNTKYAPEDIKYKVIRSDALIRQLENDFKKIDKDYICSKKETEAAAKRILSLDVIKLHDYAADYELGDEIITESENVHNESKNIEELRQKLIAFRKETATIKNIPAYYVFTNDELEALLDKMPKSIDELRSLNILSDIKIKVHGENVIKILNS